MQAGAVGDFLAGVEHSVYVIHRVQAPGNSEPAIMPVNRGEHNRYRRRYAASSRAMGHT